MEEKQEKKQEPEFKGKMGTVWLVGILVIILGCVTVYTLGMLRKNGAQDQVPLEPQTEAKVEEQKEEQTVRTTEELVKGETNNDTKKDSNKNLVAINDDKNLNKEGEIYEDIINSDSSEERIIISCVINGKNKGNFKIRKNNKIVNEQKLDKEIIEIKSLNYYYERNIFILFSDGTVGKISIEDINKKNYKINSVKDVKNIVRIQELIFTNKNAGSDIVLVAVNSNGETITLDSIAN